MLCSDVKKYSERRNNVTEMSRNNQHKEDTSYSPTRYTIGTDYSEIKEYVEERKKKKKIKQQKLIVETIKEDSQDTS